jgi:alpha-amylase/alpha-mannosidase (GH57 family)
VVEEQPKSTVPNLFVEIENNRKIATEPWTGKLLAFQTDVWYTRLEEVRRLPANLREDLTQAYTDISLADQIVWFADELGRRSQALDEGYIKLCANIAARLDRITPQLKR